MKTLIVYSTKYGCTKECVTDLHSKIKGETIIVDIQKGSAPDVRGFDNVIVGGSIYIGQLNKKLRAFLDKNKSTLLKKNVGLFTVCGFAEKADETIKEAFPEKLLRHAKSVECFGGELSSSKMGFLHRKVVDMVSKERDITKIKTIPKNISAMADAINSLA